MLHVELPLLQVRPPGGWRHARHPAAICGVRPEGLLRHPGGLRGSTHTGTDIRRQGVRMRVSREPLPQVLVSTGEQQQRQWQWQLRDRLATPGLLCMGCT